MLGEGADIRQEALAGKKLGEKIIMIDFSLRGKKKKAFRK